MPEITHLERREIQAPLAASLIRAYAEELGYEKAVAIASEAIQADAESAGAKAAEAYGGNGLRELARYIREVWTMDNALSINVLEYSETRLRFDVTRCRYAELYDKLGIKEFGVCLSCGRDEPFARGFNPHIHMKRTHTIMEGNRVCDFLFEME